MSKLVLRSEPLAASLEGRAPSEADALQALLDASDDPSELRAAAAHLARAKSGNVATFSKKAFVSATRLCRDTCTYCTYKQEPQAGAAPYMEKQGVISLLKESRKLGCTEALIVAGERPEERYGQARAWLAKNGFGSTADYMAWCSQAALNEGLYPHTNAGNLDEKELAMIAQTNPSIGMMLESSSPRLSERGMPHEAAPSKLPAERIAALRRAGRARIPTTTGILVGIGETRAEIAGSLAEMRALHARYGHIQEIILQNFAPKPDIIMSGRPGPEEELFMNIVALARVMMPEMNIQVPPNLSPSSYGRFLAAGINDWGGISPITPDYVNPEMPWPQIGEVERRCAAAGFALKCRFPVYPEFIGMAGPRLQEMIRADADSAGHVREARWR